MKPIRRKLFLLFCCVLAASIIAVVAQPPVKWVHLSSKRNQLPVLSQSTQQTGILMARLDPRGDKDAIVSFRKTAPALAWMRHEGGAWKRYVIEPEFLSVEAGGAAYDIDGDGDLDLVFGNDWQGDKLWWWENPYPSFEPNTAWKRHVIKDSGARQHHDQTFADMKSTGIPQLVFWNQKAKALLLAEIPKDPRTSGPWPLETVFSGNAGEASAKAAQYAEGVDAIDVDGDGKVDLLAGNSWFKYLGGGKYRVTRIGSIGGRIRGGRFKPGKYPQVVIAPGDGSGPLRIYECQGDPSVESSWVGRDLLDREMTHGHTLDIGDVNGDGHLDIFAAEMAKWAEGDKPADHPAATAWILYGDGKGNFTRTVFRTGDGWHEGKLADVDGDGDLDIVNKPYTWDAPRIDLWLNGGTGRRRARTRTGMELYTYRRELARNLAATLADIRALGISDVETASFYGRTATEFRKVLDVMGLTCSSVIVPYTRLKNDMSGVVADAQAVGAYYVLTSGIPKKGELTIAETRQAAADFNHFGAHLKQAGLQFGYHPHGFEFVSDGKENRFDLVLAETDPELVTYEMDVFWFAHAGADPVKYLTRYPKRFSLMHLKDLEKGTPTGSTTGRAPDETSVAIGAGMLNWKAILDAAAKAGVKKYYIEDESPIAALQVPLSLRFLAAHRR